MAKKRTDERNGENVDGEEPNFEDPEDFVDDVSDQGKRQSQSMIFQWSIEFWFLHKQKKKWQKKSLWMNNNWMTAWH